MQVGLLGDLGVGRVPVEPLDEAAARALPRVGDEKDLQARVGETRRCRCRGRRPRRLRCRPSPRTCAFTQARTAGICATADTCCVTSMPRSCASAVAPSISGTNTPPSAGASVTDARGLEHLALGPRVGPVHGEPSRRRRAIERAGIDVEEAEPARDPLRRRRLARRGRSIDRDDEVLRGHAECAPERGRSRIADTTPRRNPDRRSRSRCPRAAPRTPKAIARRWSPCVTTRPDSGARTHARACRPAAPRRRRRSRAGSRRPP